MLVAGAEVFGPGADQAVMSELLAHMGRPAGDPAAGKNRGEDIGRDSQVVIG